MLDLEIPSPIIHVTGGGGVESEIVLKRSKGSNGRVPKHIQPFWEVPQPFGWAPTSYK